MSDDRAGSYKTCSDCWDIQHCKTERWCQVHGSGRKAPEKEIHTFADVLTKLAETKPDLVNHPPHYTNHPSGIECIQITRHMNFNIGNALKYIWRADQKGSQVENLKKAIWYLEDEIKRIEG